MKTATKNVKIGPLCPVKVALGVRRENFIGLEGVNYGVRIASTSLKQELAV